MPGNPVPGRTCPECGAPVDERVNRKTETPFWGCSTWPACDWTMPIPADEWMRRSGSARLPGFE